jgi:hypothetical protein
VAQEFKEKEGKCVFVREVAVLEMAAGAPRDTRGGRGETTMFKET